MKNKKDNMSFVKTVEYIRKQIVPSHTQLWFSLNGKYGNLYDDCVNDIENNINRLIRKNKE